MQGDSNDAIDALGRLAEAFARRRRQLAASADLSESQWQLLEQVATEHFLPSLFARSQRCTPAAVSRTLRQLRERDLVTSEIDGEDGRQRRYALTSHGRKLLTRIRRERREAIASIWEDWPGIDLERFTTLASGLAERLDRYADERESR